SSSTFLSVLAPSLTLPSPSPPLHPPLVLSFFFNDPPPPQISPLSLHDALPISSPKTASCEGPPRPWCRAADETHSSSKSHLPKRLWPPSDTMKPSTASPASVSAEASPSPAYQADRSVVSGGLIRSAADTQ